MGFDKSWKQNYPLTAHVKLLEVHCDLCNGFTDQAVFKVEQAIQCLENHRKRVLKNKQ